MEAMDAIFSRRSIRKYTSDLIPENVIDKLLRAAMSAPSASNEQPWHFVVIDDRRTMNEIPKFHPYSQMLMEASLAIVVCADLPLARGMEWWIQDCSAATQNILIAANANGLGAVWLGVYPKEQLVEGVRKLLGLPENIIPMCVISIGYPAERKPSANRYDHARVHNNKW